jgi:hypothetical protein
MGQISCGVVWYINTFNIVEGDGTLFYGASGDAANGAPGEVDVIK